PAMALAAPGRRSLGRGVPIVVHGGSLSLAGAAAIAAVVAGAIVVALIGWRFDRRRVARREQAVALTAAASARDTVRGPSRAGAAPSQSRLGGDLAGARARRMAPRDGEERR
ncbi:MAG TPA: hypothetical protein VL117_00285, partial [Thermoleophilia bacterium]|nr:hypothetical protein [Thermoleophilia bacterium]